MSPADSGTLDPVRRAVRRLIALRPAAWLLSHTIHPIDRAVFRASRGKFSASSVFTGLPILFVTTTGAKSGQPRTVTLVGIPDGKRIILVASNWGQERHPAWYHNVKSNPAVTVSSKAAPDGRAYLARELAGSERERAWERAATLYPGYRSYAARAGRVIPVIALEPSIAAQ